MKYEAALKASRGRVATTSDPDELLAMTCSCLALAHAINPGMTYDGAKKLGINHRELLRLAVDDVGKLAFVQFA